MRGSTTELRHACVACYQAAYVAPLFRLYFFLHKGHLH